MPLVNVNTSGSLYRDGSSGQLKEIVFVVNDGPSKQPSRPLVQTCLAGMLRFMKLDKICQISFAEYHSKRNSMSVDMYI